MLFVSLVDAKERRVTQQELMDKARKELQPLLGKVKLIVQDMSLRGFSSGRGFPIEVNVVGPDWRRLGHAVNDLMDKMNDSEVLTDVNTDYQVGMPEIRLHPDRAKAEARGVALSSIGATVNALLGGAVLGAATKYPKEGHKYDIRVRLAGAERDRAGDIDRLKIRNNRGELVPLGEVVTIDEQPTPQIITRIDRMRAVKLYANVAKGHKQSEGLEVLKKLAAETLPAGYSIKVAGSAQAFQETFQSLILAMALGILVSYMVLASQFNSFIHPVSVLMAMPSSLAGAFAALHWAQQSINMFSMIGLILLMGIVKKNSILLVDFTNRGRERDPSASVKEALLAACPMRLRPILMTSVATVAGAAPAALAFGPGAETRTPMAVAIIGGVILSTALTLVVVPCVYCLLARLERRRVVEAESAAA
jgi:HAE1 family hydrophobic/amphiphilic exporter-1